MSGLNVAQLKHLVVAPTLAALGLGEPAAINLLTGTALAESKGVYLRQLNGGPALGLWQMEAATHDDCWSTFLDDPARSALRRVIEGMLVRDQPRAAQLVFNLRYGCAMARIKFYRAPSSLPPAWDAEQLSLYHKKFYNTAAGAADYKANTGCFCQAIEA